MYSLEKFEAGYAANVKKGMKVRSHDEALKHYCEKRHLDPQTGKHVDVKPVVEASKTETK